MNGRTRQILNQSEKEYGAGTVFHQMFPLNRERFIQQEMNECEKSAFESAQWAHVNGLESDYFDKTFENERDRLQKLFFKKNQEFSDLSY